VTDWLCGKRPVGIGRQQVEYQPVARPGTKEGQQYPRLYQQKHRQ